MKNIVKMFVSVTLCLTLVTGVFGGGIISHAVSDEVKTIDMYLLAGQSNAVGYSDMIDIAGTYENVWYAGEVERYANGYVDSYSWLDSSKWKKCVTTGYGGRVYQIGPEFGIASVLNDMYAGTDTKAMIFKTAVGGTQMIYNANSSSVQNFGNWSSTSTWDDDGVRSNLEGALYQRFLDNFTTVYNQLIAEGYNVNVKGMVWQQGESDCDKAAAYKPLLQALITDVRNDLGGITGTDLSYMPFVIGEINETYDGKQFPKNGYVNPYIAGFTSMQREVASQLENVKTVETSDLPFYTPYGKSYSVDPWHYSGYDMVELGRRFGDTLVDMNSIKLDDFTMLGASVRVNTSKTEGPGDGISFEVGIKKSVWETIKDKQIHVLAMPQRLVTGELEKEESYTNGTVSASAIDAVITGKWEETTVCGVEYMKCYTYLYGVPELFYDTLVIGRAYYEDDNTIVYSNEITRSFAHVVDAAIKDETWTGNKGALDKYLPTYTVSFIKDGETKATQQVKYGQKAIRPTDEWISDGGLVVDRWLDNGEIWHFNRPVCKNLELTPLMMIGYDNDKFEVLSGGYQLSEDKSTVSTLRNGKLLFSKFSIPDKETSQDLNYEMEFSLETPSDVNLAGATDNAIDRNHKGFMFGFDESNESYWMFAFIYENGGFYPYIRHSSNVNGIRKGMDTPQAFESGKWYDYKITVVEKDSSTDIAVQYKVAGTDVWQDLISNYSFSYRTSGRRVGFLAAGPMKFGANVSLTPSNKMEQGFGWDDNWSEALDKAH